MKNTITFLIFIIYATLIFFVGNTISLLVIFLINVMAMLITHVSILDAIKNIAKLSPFILLTVVINCFLADYIYAILIGVKLILVCNITYTYSKNTTVKEIANTIKKLCTPLKLIKVNPDDIELLVCISLSMIPILKKEYIELKEACIAKGIDINVKNTKLILTKLLVSILKRVNELEEAVIEKGYN